MYSPLSFSFRLLGIDNRLPRLNVRGHGSESCDGFFPFTQCFFSFVESFFACIQLSFSLSKLRVSSGILLLAAANRHRHFAPYNGHQPRAHRLAVGPARQEVPVAERVGRVEHHSRDVVRMAAETYLAFGPDTLAEARNRNYRRCDRCEGMRTTAD